MSEHGHGLGIRVNGYTDVVAVSSLNNVEQTYVDDTITCRIFGNWYGGVFFPLNRQNENTLCDCT